MIPAAFYAPLKGPHHPRPSGDRTLARGLLTALEQAGFAMDLASELRLLDVTGDAGLQAGLRGKAEALVPALVARGRAAGWRFWLSYHNYYKAPDLLGPAVAGALGIPYVLIEASRAKKRLTGPWAGFAAAAEAACDAADLMFYFTHRDAEALQAYAPEGQRLVHLPPFLARSDLPPMGRRDGAVLAVGMMRPGDKFESYRLIAQTLALMDPPALQIAGGGTTRGEVAALMAPFGNRVEMLGELDAGAMAQCYQVARLLFWPGVNEAIGLTYLEAQSYGLPVLAQDRPGLREVLAPGVYPGVEAGPEGLAARLAELLARPPEPEAIRAHIAAHHLLPAAAKTMKEALMPLVTT